MIKLFACLGSGNCFKPWLAMTQLGTPFELSLVNVLTGEQKTPEYLQINPLGVVPYLVTDTGQGIGESNAMLWYLAEGTHLMPMTPAARAEALQWMFFEQSKLEPFISPARFFTTILPGEKEAKAIEIKQWQLKADTGLARLDAHLAGRQFILDCGYSVADIALFGYGHVLEEAGLRLADYPAVARWIDQVSATEHFQPLSLLGAQEARVA
ncbi:MAG: glutathione S-transferase family protein [Pseudomonadota bacterium]